MQFYYQSLDVNGNPAFDEHGIPLLDCSRGTNDVENSHKQIITTFGTWCTGVEMAECLVAERRHRYNHKISEKRRQGFPKLGHFDTWLIDKLQMLVEKNHNVHFMPSWPNTADFASTSERFGTVPIHSEELDKELAKLKDKVTSTGKKQLTAEAISKFTSDQRFLCLRMGTIAPFLPVHGENECRLFDRLIRTTCSHLNMDKMSIEWCNYVDGVDIFPKLPVYLRTHHSSWLHSENVRQAVKRAAKGDEALKMLNDATLRELVTCSSHTTDTATTATTSSTAIRTLPVFPLSVSTARAPLSTLLSADDEPQQLGISIISLSKTVVIPSRTAFIPFGQHPPIAAAIYPTPEKDSLIVGGTIVSNYEQLVHTSKGPRKSGERQRDQKQRAARRCKKCTSSGRSDEVAMSCAGANSRGTCRFAPNPAPTPGLPIMDPSVM